MIVHIGNMLSPQQVASILDVIATAPFIDGRRTAGWAAQTVKNNLQLQPSPEYEQVSQLVRGALLENDMMQAAALPKALSPLLFTRTEVGMGYGAHVDNALLGSPPMRTDLAFTLFLSQPETYAGGELVIVGPEGEDSIKLSSGELVLYPATTVHRVETVSSGVRVVCVGWIQSLVRDPRIREMCFDLWRLKCELFQQQGKSEAFDLVSKTQSNLLRLHAEL